MVDVHSRKQRSYNMSRIRSRDTGPEIKFRKLLFSEGLRGYRISAKLPGKPDIIFRKYKLAIFIDGCFWHKCPKCFIGPETHKKFWQDKIKSNVERDKKVNGMLASFIWNLELSASGFAVNLHLFQYGRTHSFVPDSYSFLPGLPGF